MARLPILSDAHDQIANLRATVEFCNLSRVDFLLHFGDLISRRCTKAGSALAAMFSYDIICSGHSHCSKVERCGNSLLINPGQLLGNDDLDSFVILDLKEWKIQRIRVASSMFDRDINLRIDPETQLPGRPDRDNQAPAQTLSIPAG